MLPGRFLFDVYIYINRERDREYDYDYLDNRTDVPMKNANVGNGQELVQELVQSEPTAMSHVSLLYGGLFTLRNK